MKKLLLIALLTVAMVLTLVACQEDTPGKETGKETTAQTPAATDDDTQAPGTDDVTAAPKDETDPPVEETDPPVEETDPPVEETDPPVEETDPPVEETDPPVEETDPPAVETDPPVVDLDPVWWDVNKDVVTHQSFDELRINGDGGNGVFAPGQSAGWDGIANLTEGQTFLSYWGWIGIATDTVGQFGYAINGGEIIYDDSFAAETGDDVINAAAGTGAQTASRMLIKIDLAGLGGENTVTVYYKGSDDKVVILNEFTVNLPKLTEFWDVNKDIVCHLSFDELRINGGTGVFAPGASAGWDGIAALEGTANNLYYWGWVGVIADSIGQFGYQIDGGDIIYKDSFAVTADEGVIAAAQGNGATTASRMGVSIDISAIYGEHIVKVYYKDPAGVACILSEFTIIKDEPVNPDREDDHDFASDVASQPIDTPLSASDLVNALAWNQGASFDDCKVYDGYYKLVGINAMSTTTNGKYVYSVDVMGIDQPNMSTVFVRGIRAASKECQYYGDQGAATGGAGGSGIYLSFENGQLRIDVRSFTGVFEGAPYDGNPTTASNLFYAPCSAEMNISIADAGSKLYIFESGTLAATIEISGTRDFGLANVPADAMADKVTITIGDTSTTVENAFVAASHISDVGITARASTLTFTSLSLKPLSSITLPDDGNDTPSAPTDAELNGHGLLFHTSVDHVNGKGPNGSGNYAGQGGNTAIGFSTIDAVADEITIGDDYLISIGGWMGTPGGVNRYVYSIDGGITWLDVVAGGADGEPVPNHYSGIGYANALKNGMFNGANMLVADLSAAAGQTIDVFFAAVPEESQDKVIPFVKIAGVSVPAAAPIDPADPLYPMLDGTYYVIDPTTGYDAAVTLTIAKTGEGAGTLNIASEMFPSVAGDYNWTYTTAGGLVVDGLEIMISLNQLGNPMVQFAGLPVPMELVTEIPTKPEAPKSDLVVGANAVSDNGFGTPQTFVAPADGEYIFAYAEGETNGDVMIETDTGSEYLAFPYTKTMTAGEAFTIIVCTLDWNADVIDIVITQVGAETPGVPVEPSVKVDTPYIIEGQDGNGALYFDGTLAGGRINGSRDIAAAKVVYLEAGAAAGEFYIYFMDGETKTYIGMNSSASSKTAAFIFSTEKNDNCIFLITDEAAGIFSKNFANRGIGTKSAETRYNNFSSYSGSNLGSDEYDFAWFADVPETPAAPEM